MERQREHERYQEYLAEQDSEKMPRAFDLGWRRNLTHLSGDRPLLWPLPICTTIGDGWRWDPSPRFLEARERLRVRRDQDAVDEQQYHHDLYQRNMDNGRSWAGGAGASGGAAQPAWTPNNRGLRPDTPDDRPPTSVSLQTLAPMSPRPRPGDSDFEDDLEGNGLLDGNRGGREQSDEWRDWD
jgi:palmitoyltransferase